MQINKKKLFWNCLIKEAVVNFLGVILIENAPKRMILRLKENPGLTQCQQINNLGDQTNLTVFRLKYYLNISKTRIFAIHFLFFYSFHCQKCSRNIFQQ